MMIMNKNYKGYLEMKDSLSFEEAMEIYDMIVSQIREQDEDIVELWIMYLKKAQTYAMIRSGWYLQDEEKRRDESIDKSRTYKHNSVITATNALARCMKMNGLDDSWRIRLGDEKEHRKKLGDFACYVTLIQGINAR